MTSPDDRVPVAPIDPVARQVLGAFLGALVLVLPLHAALGATGKREVLLWVLAAVLLAVAVGWVLRMIGVPRGLGTSLAAGGVFGVVAVITLTAWGLFGLPDGDAGLSLLAGVPAAAVASLAAALIQRRSGDDAGLAVGVGMVSLFLVLAASSPLGGLLGDARDDAAQVRVLETTGLTPYLPELEGMRARFEGPSRNTLEHGPGPDDTYRLTYRDESLEDGLTVDAAYLDVEVTWAEGLECDRDENSSVTCAEGDGYVTLSRDGQAEAVIVDRDDGMRLTATLNEGDGELPAPSDVGTALAEASAAGWDEIVDLTDN